MVISILSHLGALQNYDHYKLYYVKRLVWPILIWLKIVAIFKLLYIGFKWVLRIILCLLLLVIFFRCESIFQLRYCKIVLICWLFVWNKKLFNCTFSGSCGRSVSSRGRAFKITESTLYPRYSWYFVHGTRKTKNFRFRCSSCIYSR